MLKREETIHKESINIKQVCSRENIVNLKCTIEYFIEDFKVQAENELNYKLLNR